MSKLGGYIALFGVVSIILSFFNYELKILMWINNWGETTGWIIRIALIIIGVVLFFLGAANDSEEEEQKIQQSE